MYEGRPVLLALARFAGDGSAHHGPGRWAHVISISKTELKGTNYKTRKYSKNHLNIEKRCSNIKFKLKLCAPSNLVMQVLIETVEHDPKKNTLKILIS